MLEGNPSLATQQRYRLLIIDDEEVDIMLVTRSLQKAGIPVQYDTANDATAALAALRSGTLYDCIFLDFLLPGIDGLELLKNIREMGVYTPVVVVTSHGDENVAVEVMKSGGTDYLTKKSLSPESIGRILRNAIRTQQIEEQRRAAEAALRDSQRRLEESQQFARIGGWEIQPPSRQAYWSDEIFRILGYEPGAFEPSFEKYLEILHPDDRRIAREAFEKCLEQGEPFKVDVRMKPVTQTYRFMEIHGKPLPKPDGSIHKITGTLQDITDRKAIEEELRIARDEAEKQARARQEFLANMSHEIRTPLNAILGFTALLEDTQLSAEQREYISTISSAGYGLLDIVNDILDLSRIEAGKLTFVDEPYQPAQIAKTIFGLFRPGLKDKPGLSLDLDIAENVPVWVTGDPGRLRQVLTNLVGNSMKFTSKGSVMLRISAPAEGKLRFEVRDTGIGISPEKLESIFERFTQAESATAKSYGGSGLGLTISKRLVDMQGGTMGVESRENEGSLFWFEIPFRHAEMPAGMEKNQDARGSGETGTQASINPILLVEDNALSRTLASRILRQKGYEIVEAADGLEALELLETRDFSLVLMDVQMPGMDGRHLTRTLRAHLPEPRRSVPVIAFTAHAVQQEIEACIKAGMNGFLLKPVNQVALINTVERFVFGRTGNNDPKTNWEFIDVQNLREFSGGDPEFERELTDIFLTTSGQHLNTMRESAATGNWPVLAKSCHAMKPSFQIFGVKGARELCGVLEQIARSEQNLGEVPSLLDQIAQQLEHTKQELAKYRETLG